jgi:hypothetical protein
VKSRTARRLRGWDMSAAPWSNSCAGKIRYSATSDAARARREIGDRMLMIYSCRHCSHWHLGHAGVGIA